MKKMAATNFTDEELNYFRLCSVITNDVPEGLRTVFKQQWNTRYQATHGQWLDTAHNATAFYNEESPRNQRRNARLLTVMANGNSNQWDCTCLFYALLYSDCLGPFLNITVKENVDNLRKIRNYFFAHNADGRITDVDFQDAMRKILVAFTALGLDTTRVNEMKNQKSFPTDELSRIQQQLDTEMKRYAKFHSFCVLPPKPSHDTTDRVDEVKTINHEMKKLRNTKKNETTVIYLSGNPGCGKSEIARQIGNKYFDEIPEDTNQFKFVFTINASSLDTLLQSYVDFAARLSCDEDSVTEIATSEYLSLEDKIQKIRSVVNSKVQIYSWWLIIVDNVNDLKLVSKYLPQAGEKTSGDGQILVTTQDSQSIPLDSYVYHYPSLKSGMKEEDAIALLSQISGCPGDRDLLLNIASALDFQPLALACAAVYMKQILNCTDKSETQWEKYLVKLQEGKREATEKVFEKTSLTYPLSMTAAARLALERVVSEDKIMMHALQFLSVIANDRIPLKYVVQYVIKCMPDEDQDFVAAQVVLSSLILLSEESSKEIRVHQVVYHGLQKWFENHEVDILKLMSVFSELKSLENAYNVTKADIIATRQLTPHFVVVSIKLESLLHHPILTDKSVIADCLLKAGSICLVQGSYEASEIFFQLCLAIQQQAYNRSTEMAQDRNLNSTVSATKKSYEVKQSHLEGSLTCSGNVNASLATSRKTLGYLYNILRDFKKAQTHLEAALVIEERLYNEDHTELTITLKNLGYCLRNLNLGEYKKAEACLQRALAIHEKNESKNADLLLADILIELVLLYEMQGESEKANAYCERVLAYMQTSPHDDRAQLSNTLHNLGSCLSNLNQEEKAITFFEKALMIDDSIHNANHPTKAITLECIGNSLQNQGKYKEAISYFEKLLAMIKHANDENDPILAATLHSLGVCLHKLEQYEKAKEYLERALSIREKGHDKNDPNLAATLHRLGICLHQLKQYEKAKEYFERALSIHEKGNDKNDPNLAATLHRLGVCLHKLKQYEKAKEYFERALSMREKGHDTNDPSLATTLHNLGVCLNELEQYEKAKEYYERALFILEKGHDKNDPNLAATLHNIGFCLNKLKQYEKAKEYFERALSIREKGHDKNDPNLVATLYNLGFCLNKLRQYEKAKEYLERTLSICEEGQDENDPNLAATLHSLGFCLNQLRQYEKAKEYLERALSILEKMHYENDPKLAAKLHILDFFLNQLKQNETAEECFERALSVREKGDNNYHRKLATFVHNLGVCVYELGQCEKAKEYLERALSIREKLSNNNAKKLGNSLHNLGFCLNELGQYEKAKEYLEKALSIREKGENKNDPKLGTTLHSLGLCFSGLRQYEKAKECYERALSIREKGDNKNSQKLANSLHCLGTCLNELGQYEKAKEYLERAQSIREKADPQ